MLASREIGAIYSGVLSHGRVYLRRRGPAELVLEGPRRLRRPPPGVRGYGEDRD